MRHTRIMTVEPHTAMRDGLAALISGAADMELVGTASATGEALRLLAVFRPDLLIVDAEVFRNGNSNFIQEVRAALQGAQVVALVSYEWDDAARTALDSGASAFLPKDQIGDQLLPLIRQIFRVH